MGSATKSNRASSVNRVTLVNNVTGKCRRITTLTTSTYAIYREEKDIMGIRVECTPSGLQVAVRRMVRLYLRVVIVVVVMSYDEQILSSRPMARPVGPQRLARRFSI